MENRWTSVVVYCRCDFLKASPWALWSEPGSVSSLERCHHVAARLFLVSDWSRWNQILFNIQSARVAFHKHQAWKSRRLDKSSALNTGAPPPSPFSSSPPPLTWQQVFELMWWLQRCVSQRFVFAWRRDCGHGWKCCGVQNSNTFSVASRPISYNPTHLWACGCHRALKKRSYLLNDQIKCSWLIAQRKLASLLWVASYSNSLVFPRPSWFWHACLDAAKARGSLFLYGLFWSTSKLWSPTSNCSPNSFPYFL